MTKAIPAAKTKFWLSKATVGGTPGVSVTPTEISKAKPAKVTAASTTGITNGMLVYCSGTGFSELDGKFFIASGVSATNIDLVGSDTTNSTGTLGTTPKIGGYAKNTDLVQVCVSAFSRQSSTSETVSVGTFCDPSATIPGEETPGSATISGYMDPTEDGYIELVEASELRDERVIQIELPDNAGSIIVRGTVNSYSEDYTLGQAISYQAQMGMTTRPTYGFLPAP